MNIFCKHDWEVVVNEYEKSLFEKTLEKNISAEIKFSQAASIATRIIILKCKKCGKLNKTIEKV